MTQSNREISLAQVNNVAKSLGIEMKEDQLQDKQTIANTMAQRVLAKVAKK